MEGHMLAGQQQSSVTDSSLENAKYFELFSRMFIDGDRVKHSDDIIAEFENREPGYFSACFQAFKHLLSSRDHGDPIHPEDILTLYKIAMRGVENTAIWTKGKKAIFKPIHVVNGYLISPRDIGCRTYATKEGLIEWFNSLQDNKHATFINKRLKKEGYNCIVEDKRYLLKSFYNNELMIYNYDARSFKQPLPIKAVVDQHLYAFYQEMDSVNSDRNKKLELICQLIQRLERLHPFYDGNGRTFSMLLLNYLLIINGFYPALQTSPNRVDGLSLQQLIEQIQADMAKSKLLLECGSSDELYQLLHEIEEADASSTPGQPPAIREEKGIPAPPQFDMAARLLQQFDGLIYNFQGTGIFHNIPSLEQRTRVLGNLCKRPEQNWFPILALLRGCPDRDDRRNMVQSCSNSDNHSPILTLLLGSTSSSISIYNTQLFRAQLHLLIALNEAKNHTRDSVKIKMADILSQKILDCDNKNDLSILLHSSARVMSHHRSVFQFRVLSADTTKAYRAMKTSIKEAMVHLNISNKDISKTLYLPKPVVPCGTYAFFKAQIAESNKKLENYVGVRDTHL